MSKQQPRRPRNLWKSKMGVEYSGLERPRQFLGAILGGLIFVAIALVIAFFMFG